MAGSTGGSPGMLSLLVTTARLSLYYSHILGEYYSPPFLLRMSGPYRVVTYIHGLTTVVTRGGIVNRTDRYHKKLFIPVILPSTFGPDY